MQRVMSVSSHGSIVSLRIAAAAQHVNFLQYISGERRMTKEKTDEEKVSELVVAELIRQTGDLGNYALKAVFVVLSASGALSVFFFREYLPALMRGPTPFESNISVRMLVFFCFVLVVIWTSLLHITMVHVRASLVLARRSGNDDRAFFAGDQILFSRRVFLFFIWLLKMVDQSHKRESSSGRLLRLPVASIAVIEAFTIFSGLLVLFPVLFSLLVFDVHQVLRTIFGNVLVNFGALLAVCCFGYLFSRSKRNK